MCPPQPLCPPQPWRLWWPLAQSCRLQLFHQSPFQVPSPGHWAAASAFVQNPVGLRLSNHPSALPLKPLAASSGNTARYFNCHLTSEPQNAPWFCQLAFSAVTRAQRCFVFFKLACFGQAGKSSYHLFLGSLPRAGRWIFFPHPCSSLSPYLFFHGTPQGRTPCPTEAAGSPHFPPINTELLHFHRDPGQPVPHLCPLPLANRKMKGGMWPDPFPDGDIRGTAPMLQQCYREC